MQTVQSLQKMQKLAVCSLPLQHHRDISVSLKPAMTKHTSAVNATYGMLLHILVGVLEPHPARPQLGLQSMNEARQRVRLP